MSDFKINPFKGFETSKIEELNQNSKDNESAKVNQPPALDTSVLKSDENESVSVEISENDFSNFNFNDLSDGDENPAISGENLGISNTADNSTANTNDFQHKKENIEE